MDFIKTLSAILGFLSETPLTAFLDIGGHLCTGLFLVQCFFHEAPMSKKLFLAFCVGLLPDFDYFTFGLVPHKTSTHTIWFLVWSVIAIFYTNREDRDKEGISPSVFKRWWAFLNSRWVWIVTSGTGLHLTLDFFCRRPVWLNVVYTTTFACLAIGMTVYNSLVDRPKPKKKFRVRSCVVENICGEKYFVCETTQAGIWEDESDHFPYFFVPGYAYPTEEGRELVRQVQKEKYSQVLNLWEKIDQWFIHLVNKKETVR